MAMLSVSFGDVSLLAAARKSHAAVPNDARGVATVAVQGLTRAVSIAGLERGRQLAVALLRRVVRQSGQVEKAGSV